MEDDPYNLNYMFVKEITVLPEDVLTINVPEWISYKDITFCLVSNNEAYTIEWDNRSSPMPNFNTAFDLGIYDSDYHYGV
jgi:hypothetical protein